MADKTAIEWTDATWNPLRARNLATGKVGWFCTHVSEGCRHCYAEGFNARLGTGVAYKPQHLGRDVEVFLDAAMLTQPLRWKRPRRIFVGSMTDLFADFVTDEMLDEIFAVMALTPRHTYQLLTKRPERMREYLTAPWRGAMIDSHVRAWIDENVDPLNRRSDDPRATALEADDGDGSYQPLPNVWLGTSAEDDDAAEERVLALLRTPASVRFVSAEPLLGRIDFKQLASEDGLTIVNALRGKQHVRTGDGPWVLSEAGRIDWVIVGGESGPEARPMHPDWVRQIRDDCIAAGVAFFFKQWGQWTPGENVKRRKGVVDTATWFDDGWLINQEDLADEDGHADDEPDLYRVGKRAAGNVLDGRTHLDFPEPRR